MASEETLQRIQAKVDRARQLMDELHAAVHGFLATAPYEGGIRHDDATNERVYFLKSVRQPPIGLASLVGDILHNLRSALDHLAHELVVVGTGNEGPHRHVYFPLSEDATRFEAETPGKVKGMRPEAIAAIEALKPYRGGNNVLWRLHRLNIIDKHRTLIIVGAHFRTWNVGNFLTWSIRDLDKRMREAMAAEGKDVSGMGEIPAMEVWLNVDPKERMFPLKAGDELLRVKEPTAALSDKEEFGFELAFGEPGVVEGEPLEETLEQMLKTVDETIHRLVPFLN